jgi:hypothetical protein
MTVPEVPKRIWAAWFQGWDAAPDLVRMNLTRWAALNPGWEVELLDQAAADALLAGSGIAPRLPPQALSDVVRVRLLQERGGVWADATVYPCCPLDEWLPDVLTEGFFLFKNPEKPHAVPNWLLAGVPGHPLATTWWEDTVAYWSRPRTVLGLRDPWRDEYGPSEVRPDSPAGFAPYLWTMRLWTHRRLTDPDFAAAVDRIPAMDERPAWLMLNFHLRHALTPERLRKAADSWPVQKLDWRPDGWPLDLLATTRLPA